MVMEIGRDEESERNRVRMGSALFDSRLCVRGLTDKTDPVPNFDIEGRQRAIWERFLVIRLDLSAVKPPFRFEPGRFGLTLRLVHGITASEARHSLKPHCLSARLHLSDWPFCSPTRMTSHLVCNCFFHPLSPALPLPLA